MDFLSELRRRRLLAILRCSDPERALGCLRVLAGEGIDLVEVSLTGGNAISLLAQARDELGDAITLGAGTVMTTDQARAAIDAGASYLVTPSMSEGAAEGIRLGVPVLVGALTPTEVSSAVDRGATAVKLFPAELGGPGYLSALRGPFPDVPFVPVGGVDSALVRDFIDAGAVAVGIGSPLLGAATEDGDLVSLRRRARVFREAVPPIAGQP
jgi:2-dehydro-3-deoxyphosphogluconate aldolase/(4S)-4-hydroxy-2-oxoglutarate aldolase